MHVFPLLLLLAGCPKVSNPVAGIKDQLRVGYADGSHLHAYQSYAFIYSFANGNAASHEQAIRGLQQTGVPALQKAVAAGDAPRLVVSTAETSGGINSYSLDFQANGLSATELDAAKRAWHHLAVVLTGLDAESTTLTGHAFALQVLRERVEAGEQVDWFDPTRKPEQTVADVEHAHALISDDIDRVRAAQAAILATIALANLAHKDGAIAALEDELVATSSDLAQWRSTHRQPTPQDFGVVWQMPDPQQVQAVIKDQLGIVGAAVDVARGAATGNLPATLDGLARMAPKDSKLRTVGEGLAAASKGDIKGTLGAISELGGPRTQVGRVAGRLELVAGALKLLPE